jgi:hypothetical protein
MTESTPDGRDPIFACIHAATTIHDHMLSLEKETPESTRVRGFSVPDAPEPTWVHAFHVPDGTPTSGERPPTIMFTVVNGEVPTVASISIILAAHPYWAKRLPPLPGKVQLQEELKNLEDPVGDSVTWNVREVDNSESLFIGEQLDEMAHAIITSTRHVGIAEIADEATAEEFYARLRLWEYLTGTTTHITLDELWRMIGLKTNTYPKSRSEFIRGLVPAADAFLTRMATEAKFRSAQE